MSKIRAAMLVAALAILSASAAHAEGVLRVGLLAELSGTFAPSGSGERNGIQIYLNSHGGTLGGLKVELFQADTAADPTTAISKLKKLVESDHIDVLLGPTNSAVGIAIKQYVIDQKLLTFAEATDDLALDGKYIFRTTFWGRGDSYLTTRLMAVSGIRNIVTLGPNYVAGQDSLDSAEKGFKDGGGLKVTPLLPRLGSLDYGPFIGQFPPDAEAGFVFLPGTDGVHFIKQYADFGKPIPLYGPSVTVDEQQLPVIGKAAEGFVTIGAYFSTLDLPENKRLMALWGDGFQGQGKPTWQTIGGYIAGEILDKAIAQLQGRIDDKDALIAAIAAIKLETPRGSFSFSPNHDAVSARYVAQIRDVGGKQQPVILSTLPTFVPGQNPVIPAGITLPRKE